MTLGQKQRKFTRMVADLICFAYDNGYELTFAEAYRAAAYAIACHQWLKHKGVATP